MMDRLPDDEADLLRMIDEDRQKGSAALAHLMVLCYWLNGQHSDYLAYVTSSRPAWRTRSQGDRQLYLLQFPEILENILHLSPDQFKTVPLPNSSQQPAVRLVAEIAALRGIGAPESRLIDQTQLLHELLLAEESGLVPAALAQLRDTCLDPGWTFKYRLRLLVLVDLLWMYRECHQLIIYNFIVSLLVEEAKAGLGVRAEPGPGIVTIDELGRFARYWCDPAEVQRLLTQIPTWAEALGSRE